jgi:lipopolysaccharide assembly outer membrane protein LptD (OstA)
MKQLLFLIGMLCALSMSAQKSNKVMPKSNVIAQAKDTTKLIYIDNSNRLKGGMEKGKPIKIFVGRVRLHQGNVRFECDSAVTDNYNNVKAYGNVLIRQADTVNIFSDSLFYEGNTRLARLAGNVVLADSSASLFTDKLYYDMNTKVAQYNTGGILQNKETRLFSQKGYYFVENAEAFFKDEVVVEDPQFSLEADTLKINTETNTVFFMGPTNVLSDGNQIYTESGFYDAQNDYAEFDKNAKFRSLDGNRFARGNKIRYDGKAKTSYLEGDAFFQDSTRTIVSDVIKYNQQNDTYETEGKTQIQDGDQIIMSDGPATYDVVNEEAIFRDNVRIINPPQFITADSIRYNKKAHFGRAFGNVILQDTTENRTIICHQAEFNDSLESFLALGRPLMSTVIDGDTLYLSADTLKSFLEVPTDSTSRVVIGNIDVRVYKSNLQAICDSMIYTQRDSIFSLFKSPVVWSDTSQFLSDTVRIQLANNSIDKIYLLQNAFIINSEDGVFFNQVKGRDVTAQFGEDEMRQMNVFGNGESVYYVLDEFQAYIGVNKTICSEMLLNFGNNEITDIRFFTKPSGQFTPMKQANHNALRLPGFRWIIEQRPTSVEDLR